MTQPLIQEPAHQLYESLKQNTPLPHEESSTAVALPHSKEDGYSPIYRNLHAYKKGSLLNVPHDCLNTLPKLLKMSVSVNADQNCLGTRFRNLDGSMGAYQWETYKEIDARKKNFGAGLFFILQNNPFKTNSEAHLKIDQHLNIKNGMNEDSFIVSLFSANRREWCISDLACLSYSIVNTALYDTLGPETSKYILSITESPVIICSKDKISKIIELKEQFPQDLSNLISIVSMDKLDFTTNSLEDLFLHQRCSKNNLTLFDFNQVEKFGEIYPVKEVEPTPKSVYTISFTSGTTGSNPKGVVLTHQSAVSAITFCYTMISGFDAVVYCFLPLAHIFERMNCLFSLFQGAHIGLPQLPSPLTLLDDIKELKPEILSLVPRVYTKLEAAIKSKTINNNEKPLLQKIFRKVVDTKTSLQSKYDGAEGRHLIYDRFSSVLRKQLGFDNLHTFATGSAPISPDTVKFMKASLNTGMSQGYGLTESFAGICCSLTYDANPGSCGPISVTTEMRLREIPEMGYHANDEGGPRGELLLRGAQIFTHYYKDPEETRKSIDDQGWFYTGDIAKVDAETGRMYIIDRVKNFFKLAQGEYITPEKIENTYLSHNPLIQQCYVHGDSLKTFLVGIIGVEPVSIKAWLFDTFKIKLNDDSKLIETLNDVEIKKKFLIQINHTTNKVLGGFEKLHNILIDIEPLSVEKNVITPTLKIKRPIASKFFAKEFEQLYEQGSILRIEDSKL
ncbi:acetyl-CoA synthetase-like protein [Hyphopichia burtonii NRRL Y-1933]|uniref:Acetyl-CoA synthetase-like protein n=1 Tax=Hyphopichia burtonii NRRL Y-1933 TaxID=984485 RepID=A0A1E4RNE8_9ASCO|nr:acetyl-CoA synthetase-like protein [Hyphopichia burtonii NRRL Y-1933]ODV68798.1 acetyl-CoA synthetase-like protein [Hyphopichia burtonii NRRL Y-1933]